MLLSGPTLTLTNCKSIWAGRSELIGLKGRSAPIQPETWRVEHTIMNGFRKVFGIIDSLNNRVGQAVSWLTLFLVIITIYDVLMRYVFRSGSIWIQEAEWHLFSANFMLAGGWTLLRDGHVRVDLFYSKFTPRTKALIDLGGAVFFLIPYCALIVWASFPYVADSWGMWEGSQDPGGLPGRFILKTVIPVTFILIGFQGISQIMKNIFVLTGRGEQS